MNEITIEMYTPWTFTSVGPFLQALLASKIAVRFYLLLSFEMNKHFQFK